MNHASVPVDLQNPGQVFACLGLMETAEVICGPTMSRFDWSDPAGARFYLAVEGESDPISRVLGFLAECEVRILLPLSSDNAYDLSDWTVEEETATEPSFSSSPPASPAALPALLRSGGKEIKVDYWGDTTSRDNVKFWAGAKGMPGPEILLRTLRLITSLSQETAGDPFAISVPQSSSFRFDWRRDYVPVDLGFSLNPHKASIQTLGYPFVEVLAAIGLSNARPRRVSRRNKLQYTYSVHARELSAALQRALLGAEASAFPARTFLVQLAWPGKEGQARCITSVTETTPSNA